MAEEGQSGPLLFADQPGVAAATYAGGGGSFTWLPKRRNLISDWCIFVLLVVLDCLLFPLYDYIEWYHKSVTTRWKLKEAIWVLTALLTIVFACNIPVKVLLSWRAVASFLGGFYALSILRCKRKEILNSSKGVTASTFILKWLSIFGDPNPDDVKEDFKAPCELSSSASVHVVGKARMLQTYSRYSKPWPIKMADGRCRKVIGHGTIKWGSFIIPNVRHVQGLDGILISVNQLDRDHNLDIFFSSGICLVTQRDDGTAVGRGTQTSTGLYVLSSLHVPEGAS
ncbi:unnamed protein product [Urochloa humidicola]